MSTSEPFTLAIPTGQIRRIQDRVRNYDWPPEPAAADWRHGVPVVVMRSLAQRWLDGFDWPAQQSRINRFRHFTVNIEGAVLHFVHMRATAGSPPRLPVVLLHGWPSSFVEYLDVAERLATGPAGAVRDVVIASLPGFGFSSAPATFVGPRAVARLIDALMTNTLGYARYAVHGSDWGAIVAGWLGFDRPETVGGIHMTMVSPRFIAGAASEPAEQQWLAGFRERFEEDGAYFRLQTSRPLTFGFALNDTPVGLLAWITEKRVAWADPALKVDEKLLQDPEAADRLLTNVMIYLVTGTAASSAWLYRGLAQEGPPGYPNGLRVEVPVGFAATRDPVFVPPPRSLVQKAYNVVRWTEYAQGGHFPAEESPEELCADLEAFIAQL